MTYQVELFYSFVPVGGGFDGPGQNELNVAYYLTQPFSSWFDVDNIQFK